MTTESDAECGGGAVPPQTLSAGKPTLCMINYNGERFLEASLRSVVAQSERFAELILVDDASEDGSLEMVRREFPSVRIVELPENRGPAAARNVALRASCTDLVVLVDNDVSLAYDCIQRLMAALAAHPGAVIAAPTVLHAHDRGLIQYDGPRNHFLGLMSFHRQDVPFVAEDHGPREICSLVSACFLVDRSRLPDPEPSMTLSSSTWRIMTSAYGCARLAVPSLQCRTPTSDQLHHRVGNSANADRVRVLPRQPRPRMDAFTELASVLVSPRNHGGNFPLKIFDYLAAGKPIVATDVPAHRAVLDDTLALLVPASPAALAEGVIRVLRDRELAERLAAAAAACCSPCSPHSAATLDSA